MRCTGFRIERGHNKDVRKFISSLKYIPTYIANKTTQKAMHFNFYCGKISVSPLQ